MHNLEIYGNFNSAEPTSIHIKMGMKLIKLLSHPTLFYKHITEQYIIGHYRLNNLYIKGI